MKKICLVVYALFAYATNKASENTESPAKRARASTYLPAPKPQLHHSLSESERDVYAMIPVTNTLRHRAISLPVAFDALHVPAPKAFTTRITAAEEKIPSSMQSSCASSRSGSLRKQDNVKERPSLEAVAAVWKNATQQPVDWDNADNPLSPGF